MLERLDVAVPPELDPEGLERLLAAANGPAHVLVLRGSSHVFCRGLSLELAANEPAKALRCAKLLAELAVALAKAKGPVVALVESEALGGGAALAAAADLVLATPAAHFALPEVVSGLIPAVALPVVAQRIGLARARLLALSARPLSAGEAHAAGLVDEVTENLDARLSEWMKQWRRLSAPALGAVKRWAHEVSGWKLDAALPHLEACLHDADTRRRLARVVAGEAPWSDE